MDVADGPACEALAVASAVAEELAVEGGDAGAVSRCSFRLSRAGMMWTCRLVW
jgi:hypothetical protein